MINFMLYSKSEKPFQDSYYVAAASRRIDVFSSLQR